MRELAADIAAATVQAIVQGLLAAISGFAVAVAIAAVAAAYATLAVVAAGSRVRGLVALHPAGAAVVQSVDLLLAAVAGVLVAVVMAGVAIPQTAAAVAAFALRVIVQAGGVAAPAVLCGLQIRLAAVGCLLVAVGIRWVAAHDQTTIGYAHGARVIDLAAVFTVASHICCATSICRACARAVLPLLGAAAHERWVVYAAARYR